ncbi:MAG TPA: ATP-binding protein [Geobacteraceae bacterium]
MKRLRHVPLVVSSTYAVAGALWIYFSSRVLASLVPSAAGRTFWETVKGWGFIVVTTVLLYLLLWAYVRKILGAEKELAAEKDECRAAREALEESEAQFSLMFAKHSAIMYLVDPDSLSIIEVNEAARAFYGYTAAEFAELRLTALDTARDVEVQAFAREALRGGEKLRVAKHRLAGGEVRAVEIRVTPIHLTRREFLFVIATDITEREKADQEMKEALSLLAATLEATADGIFVRDPAGRIVICNRKFATMWRLPETILATQNDRQLRLFVLDQLKDPDRFLEITEASYAHGDSESCDIIEFKDGRVFERVSKPQVVGEIVVGRVISYRDITERRSLESQLRQSQKLEAIGTLAGGIAHDFNNLLTAIVGYATLMQMRMEEENPLRHQVNQILAATDRAAALTKSLLAYSRRQVSDPAPVDLNAIIREIEALLLRLLPANIVCRQELADVPLTILADAGQLEQALMNLTVNARDAMPSGGELVVSTEEFSMNAAYIAIHGYGKPGRYALLSVTDSGSGMDEDTRERIFEPFFTTKETGKGTGLGLAMVYNIVKQHGGFISVASEPGTGTTFRIYLPLMETAVRLAESRDTRPVAEGSETILVMEDDEPVRQLLRDVLESNGYAVIEAVDGVDGVEKFARHKDEIHLVLTDIMMPHKSGCAAYEEIRSMGTDVRTIFMTGYSAALRETIVGQGDMVLTKPVLPKALLAKVRAVLDGDVTAT